MTVRTGYSARTDPGGNGRSLPAAPHRTQQRNNGVTAKATPFQETNLIEIQRPPWGTFLTEGAPKGGILIICRIAENHCNVPAGASDSPEKSAYRLLERQG